MVGSPTLEFKGLILDKKGRRKICLFLRKNLICDFSRANQMPLTDQITEITPTVRTYI